MNKITVLLGLFLFTSIGYTQEDLLEELENNTTPEATFENPAFKAMKIANLQSTKVAAKKDFYLYVSHRFGTLKDGVKTFFGFDNANTKIEFVYGAFKDVQFGISRESIRKTYAGSVKFSLKRQSSSFPLNIVGYSTLNINTQLNDDVYTFLEFNDRLSYASQLILSRVVSKNISLEIAPTYPQSICIRFGRTI